MAAALGELLLDLIARHEPRSLMALGGYACRLCRDYRPPYPIHRVLLEDIGAARSVAECHDLALIAGLLEDRSATESEPVIAHLRDIAARHLIITVANLPPWTEDRMRALGLSTYARAQRPGGPAVYIFDIATYKPTPDWFGPHNWAHPELWGKYRW